MASRSVTSGASTTSQNIRVGVWLFVAAVVLLALVVGVRAFGSAGDGLTGRYYNNPNWTEPAAIVAADVDISTQTMTRRWEAVVPAAFSVRWTGTLSVPSTDLYTFELESDDGSRLFIDGALIIDNSGAHAPVAKRERVRLESGPHAVALDYRQLGGEFELAWRW